MYDAVTGIGVDPRNIAQRIMEVSCLLAAPSEHAAQKWACRVKPLIDGGKMGESMCLHSLKSRVKQGNEVICWCAPPFVGVPADDEGRTSSLS